MSRTEGKLLTCDRCGEQLFLKKVEENYLDGGIISAPMYEPKADGWKCRNGKDLCPACETYYNEVMDQFWNEYRGGKSV